MDASERAAWIGGPVITANGFPVMGLTFTRYFRGRWVCDLDVGSEEALTSPVTITDTASDFVAIGSVYRGGEHLDQAFTRVVGGAGGLREQLRARSYRAVPARVPIMQVLSETGEALAKTADAVLLRTLLPYWSRVGGLGELALTALTTKLGATWRTLLDGTVWIGTDTWPAIALEDEPLERHLREGRYSVGAEALDPAIAPGVLLFDRRVSTVIWTATPKTTRAEVCFFDG